MKCTNEANEKMILKMTIKQIFFILALDQPHFTKMKFTSQEKDLFILNLEHYLFLISKMRSLQVLWGFLKHADGVTAFANAKSKIWQTFSVLLRESGRAREEVPATFEMEHQT